MSRIKRPLLILLSVLFTGHSFACINEYYRESMPLNGLSLNLPALLNPQQKNALPYWHHGFKEDSELKNLKDSLLRIGLTKLGYKGMSDYAVVELKEGNLSKAVSILEGLYRKYPTEYNIVANLGTVYELAGDPVRALALLEEAVRLRPASHYGSEWIHLNILRQKTASRPDLTRITCLNIGNFATWVTDKKYVFPVSADSLKIQLAYQLHERISFIAPPDPVIGQLVLDFADIVAKKDSLEAAIPFYDYAVTYDPQLRTVTEGRKAVIKEERKIVKDTFRWASLVWAVPLLAFALIFVAWVRGRKNPNQV